MRIHFMATVALGLTLACCEGRGENAAVESATKTPGAEARDLHDAASVLMRRGEFPAAAQKFEASIAAAADGPLKGGSYLKLGRCYMRIPGERSKGIASFQRILDLENANPDTKARALHYLGIYCVTDTPEKAIEFFQQGLEVEGANASYRAANAIDMGNALLDQKEYSKAIIALNRVGSILQPRLENGEKGGQAQYGQAMVRISDCHLALKQYSKAVESCETALANLADGNYWYTLALINIGDAYAGLGDYAKAKDAYLQAISSKGNSLKSHAQGRLKGLEDNQVEQGR